MPSPNPKKLCQATASCLLSSFVLSCPRYLNYTESISTLSEMRQNLSLSGSASKGQQHLMEIPLSFPHLYLPQGRSSRLRQPSLGAELCLLGGGTDAGKMKLLSLPVSVWRSWLCAHPGYCNLPGI